MILVEDEGVRIILMICHEYKVYMTTTGYNRNELFFAEPSAGMAGN